jgi:hypothetical protein
MAVQLWALPLALAGGLLATTERTHFGFRWLAVGALLLLSTYTYQPAAAAALLPAFLWSAMRWAKRESPLWHRPMLVAALLLLSLASNVALVKALDWSGNDRLGGNGLAESLAWFGGEYLPRTIAFSVPTTVDSLGLSLIALAAALLSPLAIGQRFMALPCSVLIAWFAASSLVVPGELWATYRLIMTPQIMLWCGSGVCLAFTVREWHKTKPGPAKWLVVALATASVTLLCVSGYRAYVYLARPNMIDWASVQCVLRGSPPLTDRTVLVLNPFSASVSPVRSYDEYGITASSTGWALPDIAWLAAKHVGNNKAPPATHVGGYRVVKKSSLEAEAPGALRFDQDICGTLDPSRN